MRDITGKKLDAVKIKSVLKDGEFMVGRRLVK
jgi:hypothetical protein